MRTKALLLAAAFAAAGVATSMAQAVYSVNAVGYVNKTLTPGFTLISNPLTAADNKISTLFNNFQGGVRDGTTVYKYIGGGFATSGFDEFGGWGGAATTTLVPGEGAFVFIPNPIGGEAPNKVLTFVGEVPQNQTSTPIPRGFSMKSSVVPQALAPDKAKNTDQSSAAIPAVDGDSIYRWIPSTRGYKTYVYTQFDPGTPGEWASGNEVGLPVMDVGEAFYYLRLGPATTWNRTFSVNNPQ